MKFYHWIILSIAIAGAFWFIYRTRESVPRVEESLHLNWKFIQGDQPGAHKPGYRDDQWRFVSIPHDWMIEYPVDQKNPSGLAGGFYPGGIGWYRKSIDLAGYPDKDKFYLLFEGVYRNADVYFNGTHLGRQIYGYASFYHDVSDLVRRDTLNVIAVRTDCSKLPVDRWYSGAGIYRPVRLIAAHSLHIPVWGTAVTSGIGASGKATIRVATDIENSGSRSRRFEIRYDVVDPKGRIVAEGNESRYLGGGETEPVVAEFELEDPLLWSPGEPNLYAVNCYLMDGNSRIDQVKTNHGIRSIRFDADSGLILNGKKTMMKGVCLHHDGGELGAAVPLDSWERRLTILKELGVNALRLAHNPHAPGVLDLCDRMGFLVINEMYDKWETDWPGSATGPGMANHWETDLANFVKRDRNHPSVVLWSVGNETIEQLEDPERGKEIYSDLKQLVNALDSTRLVTCGMHPGTEDQHEVPSSMMHVSPIVSYNYRTDSFAAWHEKYPELVFIATETKAYGTQRPEDYHRIDFSDNSWNDMEEYVAGHFIWAGIDYLGESAGWPDRGLRNGLMLTNGFIKPYAWYIGSRYREDPMVKLTVKDSLLADSLNNSTSWQISWAGPPLVDHWSFSDQPGEKEVVVFTNCRKVDLLLNDSLFTSLDRDQFKDGVIRATLPYRPGSLVARAHYENERGGLSVVTDTLKTASGSHRLAMAPDRGQINANSRDVVHITTRVVDEAGTLDPHSSHLVNYQVDGPGQIRVIDNGDLADHTLPGSPSRKVKKGKQLLILQAGGEPGDLIISATADGLEPSSVKIKSKQP